MGNGADVGTVHGFLTSMESIGRCMQLRSLTFRARPRMFHLLTRESCHAPCTLRLGSSGGGTNVICAAEGPVHLLTSSTTILSQALCFHFYFYLNPNLGPVHARILIMLIRLWVPPDASLPERLDHTSRGFGNFGEQTSAAILASEYGVRLNLRLCLGPLQRSVQPAFMVGPSGRHSRKSRTGDGWSLPARSVPFW